MAQNNSDTLTSAIWKRRWLRWLSIVVIILALILSVLPFAIGKAMKSWLLENGADTVSIENIDFNPFTGTAVVDGLDIRVDGQTVISDSLVYFDISVLDLFKKGFTIESALFKELQIDIEQQADGKIRIGSLVVDLREKAEEEIQEEVTEELAWWLGLEKITLEACVVRYTSPQLTTILFLDHVTLQDLSTKSGGQSAKLDLKARLKESDIKAVINLEQLSPEVEVNGTLSIQKINLNDFSGYTAGILDSFASMIDTTGEFVASLSPDGDVDVRYTGKTAISNIDVANKDFAVKGQETIWDGRVLFNTQIDGSHQRVELDGKLDAKEFALNLIKQNIVITQQKISLDSQLALQMSNGATGLTGKSAIQASGTMIKDTVKAQTLFAVDKIDVDSIQAERLDQVSIKGITINQARFIQGKDSKQPSIFAGVINVTDLSFDNHLGLSIQRVALEKMAGTFVREKDGSIDIVNALQTSGATEQETRKNKNEQPVTTEKNSIKEPVAGNAFAIKISEFIVKGDSEIQFADKTVSPVFKSVLNIASLKVTDIDSSKPDQPIAINLNSKLNKDATLSVKGKVRPFAKQIGIDLKVDLEYMNMISLSPYLVATTGYMVRAGQLRIDSKIVIDKGNIDAKNTVFMKKLRLEEVDDKVANDAAGSIGMPLDRALGMLSDKNDNIKLDLPITGKLDEVEIGSGQVINTALRNATTAGMKTYLLLAFQPYGAMIVVGQMVGEQARKITLDPVLFEEGESDLADEHKGYLEKLGKVMHDRPKIDVQICAFTTAADLFMKKGSAKEGPDDALSHSQIEKLRKLGQVRGKNIKDYLVSKFKVDRGRLILCAPEYDESKDAGPRVELLI